MDRDFVVKVIVGKTPSALTEGLFVPHLIRAESAASALSSFAERSNAEIIGALHIDGDCNARGVVGVEERAFPVVVSARS